MNAATVSSSIASFGTDELKQARAAIEAELMTAIADGAQGTQAHAGQIEMLTAIGAELLARSQQSVPWVEVNTEDGARLSFSVRVF